MTLTAVMTRTQQRMFILDGLPVHRLPVRFAVPDEWTAADTRTALIGALRTAPALCSRFVFTGDRFEQVHVGLDPDQVRLTEVDWPTSVDTFCRSATLQVSLAEGPPWSAALVHASDGRFLCIEFHHIAIDGPGIAAFERTLFSADPSGSPASPWSSAAGVFALYERVAEAEVGAEIATAAHVDAAAPPRLVPTDSIRARSERDAGDTEATARAARGSGVTPRALHQAAFEAALVETADPDGPAPGYASASSWRWTFGAPLAIACLPALVRCTVGTERTLSARADRIFAKSRDPRILDPAAVDMRPAVVFSFEALGLRHGRYVPADALPRFAVYVRVDAGATTTIEVEVDPLRVPADLAHRLLDRMVELLPSEEQR